MTEWKQGGLYEDARGEKFRINKVCDWGFKGHWLSELTREESFRIDSAMMIFRPTEETPKKKRLMTPDECALKWICRDTKRHMIIGICSEGRLNVGGGFYDIAFWHSEGHKIADTPTSEPYSLEVEE